MPVVTIMAVGDVVGMPGCVFLEKNLRAIKKFYQALKKYILDALRAG